MSSPRAPPKKTFSTPVAAKRQAGTGSLRVHNKRRCGKQEATGERRLTCVKRRAQTKPHLQQITQKAFASVYPANPASQILELSKLPSCLCNAFLDTSTSSLLNL